MSNKWQIVVPEDFETTSKAYKLNGKEYYRVTHTLGIISKHRLRKWIAKVGYKESNKIVETRQAIGTHVHKLIELTLQGEKINLGTYETEIREGLCKFHEFNKYAELKPEGLEQRLWSNKHGYAGTADYVGWYKSPVIPKSDLGKIDQKFLVRGHKAKFKKSSFVVGDWKTSKDIYPQYWLQLAAYCYAFKELTGKTPDGAFICRIRDGKIKVKEKTWEELKPEFTAYLAALELYQWKYRLGKYKGLYR